jgi:hypothetical protein
MEVPAQHYQPSPRAYHPQPREWEYDSDLTVKPLNAEGILEYQHRRYFVCEVLAHQRVTAQRIGNKLLVNYRNLWVREIDILSGRTSALVLPDTPSRSEGV